MSNDYFLHHGAHSASDGKRCAMEWVAYLAGEEHSDAPACVSSLLTQFCVQLNDCLPDDKRQRLRPYLARTIGTAGDGLDIERSQMAWDWVLQTFVPEWLELGGLTDHAAAVRRHGEPAIAAAGDAARAATWAAAWVAAGDATRDAARDAAWAAAGDATRDAAWAAARAAARAAAWAAAWGAARAAAWAAAEAAARDALQPTVEKLQDSAIELLDRMLPTVPIDMPTVSDWEAVCGVEVPA